MKLDTQGWLEPADNISLRPSPNFNERPENIDISLLVIHNISLPPGQFGTPFVADLFLNQLDLSADPWFEENLKGLTVSAHFLLIARVISRNLLPAMREPGTQACRAMKDANSAMTFRWGLSSRALTRLPIRHNNIRRSRISRAVCAHATHSPQ